MFINTYIHISSNIYLNFYGLFAEEKYILLHFQTTRAFIYKGNKTARICNSIRASLGHCISVVKQNKGE